MKTKKTGAGNAGKKGAGKIVLAEGGGRPVE
jgi:hypothetical protein